MIPYFTNPLVIYLIKKDKPLLHKACFIKYRSPDKIGFTIFVKQRLIASAVTAIIARVHQKIKHTGAATQENS